MPRKAGSAPHWPTLGAAAAQGMTLVVYMGVAQLDAIVDGLRAALPLHTPAALVQDASLPTRAAARQHAGAALPHDARAEHIASPAVLIIGDVLTALSASQAQTAMAKSA